MKYYNYYHSFENTLIPLHMSGYVPDQYGQSCWIFQGKAVFAATLSQFKSNSDVDLRLYIEYLDNQSGYLRIDYDTDSVLTSATIKQYENSHLWKEYVFTFTGKCDDILNDGDFQIYSSTTESTSADIPLIVRRVGVFSEDTLSVASWQVIGSTPVAANMFGYSSSDDTSYVDTTIEFVNNPPQPTRLYGMTALGTNDNATYPLYLRIGANDPTFWRGVGDYPGMHLELEYYDRGYHDLSISRHNNDEELTDVLVTHSNQNTWLTTDILMRDGLSSTLFITSNTTNTNDPIVDASDDPYTIVEDSAYNDTNNKKYGESSIYLGGLTIAHGGELNVATQAFTMMFWARIGSTGWRFLLEEGNDDNWWFGWYNGEVYMGYFDVGGDQWQPGYSGLNNNVWHHYYIGSDGAGTMYAFLDGTNKQTRAYTNYGSAGSSLTFGTDTAYAFYGWLYDFYFLIGENMYTNDFTVPQESLAGQMGGEPIRLNGDYSDNSDIKLSSSGPNLVKSTLYLNSDTDTQSDPIRNTSTEDHIITNVDVSHDVSVPLPTRAQSSLLMGQITVPDLGQFNVSTRAFTFMFWAKLDSSGTYNMFEEGNDNNWFIRWDNGTFTLGYFNDGATTWLPSGYTGLNDDAWHHYYVGSDGAGTLYTFLDGADKQTYSYTTFGISGWTLKVGMKLGSEVFSMPDSGRSTSGANTGLSVRQYFENTILTNTTGTLIRCAFHGAVNGLNIDLAYIGKQVTDNLTFDGNQQQLYFEGSPTVSIGGDEIVYSDWVSMSVDTSVDNLIITRDHSNTIDSEYWYTGSPSGAVGSLKTTGAGLEAGDTNVSGYNSYSPRVYGIDVIEVASGSCHANDIFYLADRNIYTDPFTVPSQLLSDNSLYNEKNALYISKVTLTNTETSSVSVWTP